MLRGRGPRNFSCQFGFGFTTARENTQQKPNYVRQFDDVMKNRAVNFPEK